MTVVIIATAVFPLLRAAPAMSRDEASFFTHTERWNLVDISATYFGVSNMSLVTAAVSILALTLAIPTASGIVIFLTVYASKELAKPSGYPVDLLVTVPSIIYGL